MTFVGLPTWIVVSLLAATAAVLAVLQLLRTRPRTIRVNTTIFWAEALRASRASSLLHRFRHPLTYLLLLSIVSTVILAIGRPLIETDRTRRQSVVIVLEAGSSMGAMLDKSASSETRFDNAKQAAMAISSRLSAKDTLCLVVADPYPRLVHRFDEPKAVLTRRVDSLKPSSLPTDRLAAVRLARDLARSRTGAKIILITDRMAAGDELLKFKENQTPLEVVHVGQPLPNAAILSAMFEPDASNPLIGTFRLRVGHWAEGAGQIRAIVKRPNGTALLDESYAVAADEKTSEFSIKGIPADGQVLSVRIEGHDELEADSLLEFSLPRRHPIRVAFDAQSRPFLRTLLESDSAVIIVAPGEAADLAVGHAAASSSADSGAINPMIIIASRSPKSTAPLPGNTNGHVAVKAAGDSPLVEGLDFESGICLPGLDPADLPAQARPLLTGGHTILAAIDGNTLHQTLWLCETLIDPKATATHRPALPVFISRAVRELANWQSDPIVLSPSLAFADHCMITSAEQENAPILMPADRISGNLLDKDSAGELNAKSSDLGNAAVGSSLGRVFAGIELFEMLLLAGLCLLFCESFLHARGRIS